MPIYMNEDRLDRLFGIDDPISQSITVQKLTMDTNEAKLYALDNKCTLKTFAEVAKDLATKYCNLNQIKKVIFNCPATIVYWLDGTKTIVKCDGEEFDPEKGLAMAIAKKFLGYNQGYYYEIFKKWLPKEEEKKPAIHIAKLLRSKGARPDGKEVKHLTTRGEVKAAHKKKKINKKR